MKFDYLSVQRDFEDICSSAQKIQLNSPLFEVIDFRSTKLVLPVYTSTYQRTKLYGTTRRKDRATWIWTRLGGAIMGLYKSQVNFLKSVFPGHTLRKKSVTCYTEGINPESCAQQEDRSEHNFMSYVAMRRSISQFPNQSGFVAGSWLTFVNKH